jgi:multidrug efflux pump subunit AcrB
MIARAQCGHPDRSDRDERAQGRDKWKAVVEVTLSRFRPIMLTGVSTVLA